MNWQKNGAVEEIIKQRQQEVSTKVILKSFGYSHSSFSPSYSNINKNEEKEQFPCQYSDLIESSGLALSSLLSFENRTAPNLLELEAFEIIEPQEHPRESSIKPIEATNSPNL